MAIQSFSINSKQGTYQLFANTKQNMEYTIEFTSGSHPASLTMQYDLDYSGKGDGVTFGDGSTSFQQAVSTPGKLNPNVAGGFTLTGGQNNVSFGMTISIVEDGSQNDSIDIHYMNTSAALVLHPELEKALMKKVSAKISKAVSQGIENHVAEAHPAKKTGKRSKTRK